MPGSCNSDTVTYENPPCFHEMREFKFNDDHASYHGIQRDLLVLIWLSWKHANVIYRTLQCACRYHKLFLNLPATTPCEPCNTSQQHVLLDNILLQHPETQCLSILDTSQWRNRSGAAYTKTEMNSWQKMTAHHVAKCPIATISTKWANNNRCMAWGPLEPVLVYGWKVAHRSPDVSVLMPHKESNGFQNILKFVWDKKSYRR